MPSPSIVRGGVCPADHQAARRSCGYSLIELLTVVVLIGLFVTVSTPHFISLRRQAAMRAATKEIRGVIQKTRSRAITRSRNSAVKFQLFGDQWRYAIYDDGDFDGVRNDDIAKGIDPVVVPFTPVLPGTASMRIGLPAGGARDPDTNKLLVPSKDSPVRFNASTLCSFSPAGSGTPGTVFLTDGHTDIGAVRVFGATGRIRSQMFNRATGKWESR